MITKKMYLLVSGSGGGSLQEEAEKLKSEGYRFTGEVKTYTMATYTTFEFAKEEEAA